jgi:hypothetical protein
MFFRKKWEKEKEKNEYEYGYNAHEWMKMKGFTNQEERNECKQQEYNCKDDVRQMTNTKDDSNDSTILQQEKQKFNV